LVAGGLAFGLYHFVWAAPIAPVTRTAPRIGNAAPAAASRKPKPDFTFEQILPEREFVIPEAPGAPAAKAARPQGR
jgi:hypothetical protein